MNMVNLPEATITSLKASPAQTIRAPQKRQNLRRREGQGVELRGIEPLTPSMPWKCSTN